MSTVRAMAGTVRAKVKAQSQLKSEQGPAYGCGRLIGRVDELLNRSGRWRE